MASIADILLTISGRAVLHVSRAAGEVKSAMELLKSVDEGAGPEENVRLRLRKIEECLREAQDKINVASDDYYMWTKER